jgi:starvation-inducible DNA-binding protein
MNTSRQERLSAGLLAKSCLSTSILKLQLPMGLSQVRTDALTLFLKSKSSRRYISGPHGGEYRQLLQAQAEQLYATTHAINERVRELGGTDIWPFDESDYLRPTDDESAERITPEDVLLDVRIDNQMLAGSLRSAQILCQRSGDIVTESLIDVWIDEARRRASALMEATWAD